jgi:hypothetical protein
MLPARLFALLRGSRFEATFLTNASIMTSSGTLVKHNFYT